MPRSRSWTAEEVAKLQNMAGKYPTAQIAAELGRGITSTVKKAYELRISLRVKPKKEAGDENGDFAGTGLTG